MTKKSSTVYHKWLLTLILGVFFSFLPYNDVRELLGVDAMDTESLGGFSYKQIRFRVIRKVSKFVNLLIVLFLQFISTP